jgi:hypothetical protein
MMFLPPVLLPDLMCRRELILAGRFEWVAAYDKGIGGWLLGGREEVEAGGEEGILCPPLSGMANCLSDYRYFLRVL